MDYSTLRILHVTGIVVTFIGLTGILALKMAGGVPIGQRRVFHFAHGLGLLTIIVTGFAMAVHLGLKGSPPWLTGKFIIWLVVAGSMVLANRLSRYAPWIVVFFALLVATAAWLAIDKPF